MTELCNPITFKLTAAIGKEDERYAKTLESGEGLASTREGV